MYSDTGRACSNVPRSGDIPADFFSDAHARWAAGRCPCCASDMCEWEWNGEVAEPRAIGEGVMMCGRCVANNHHEETGFIPAMLEAIASGARRKRGEARDAAV